MEHPKPEVIRAAADRLETCVPIKGAKVNMLQPLVIRHECGTTACFAGWYAFASMQEADREWDGNQFTTAHQALMNRETNLEVVFGDGAQKLAADLGFTSHQDLERWARDHPELWGNGGGEHMFASANAFEYPEASDRQIQLLDIVNHLRGVADRVETALKLEV